MARVSRRPGKGVACLAVVAIACLAFDSAAEAAPDRRPPIDQAHEARSLEDLGAYGGALDALKALRPRVRPDADLEIGLALDEARTGQLDSARTRLMSPILTAVLADTLPLQRRTNYRLDREQLWINGQFDGWHWYVLRARAEVAAALRRWDEALEAARGAAAARPLVGREWIILATCAAQAGRLDEASDATWRAVRLDPALPEAQHWAGLMEWRAGRRVEAQQRFKIAMELDSTYRAPALAIMRSRLPGAPTEWPTTLLNGARATGLLTSTERPKIEDHLEVDAPPVTLVQMQVALPESLLATVPPFLALPVLVDEVGRVAAVELPWIAPSRMHVDAVGAIMASLSGWRFQPAVRHGRPLKLWTGIRLNLKPE